MAFEENLKKLRGKHKKWDPAAISQMDDWDVQWHEAATKKDYAEHPLTTDLIKKCKEQLVDNKRRLINERLSAEDRAEVQGDTKRLEWFLQLYSEDYAQQLKDIEQSIFEELK